MIKDKEIKKKKLLYRLKYRGIKELDILFERFAFKYFNNINDKDLEELNSLLELKDQDLLDFILNKKVHLITVKVQITGKPSRSRQSA